MIIHKYCIPKDGKCITCRNSMTRKRERVCAGWRIWLMTKLERTAAVDAAFRKFEPK